MPYKSVTYATNNENGDAEVRLEPHQNTLQAIFGLTPKERVYIAPYDWRTWKGLSVWREKHTKEFVSPSVTIEILQAIHSVEKSY